MSARCCCAARQLAEPRAGGIRTSATDSSAWSTASRSAARLRRHQPCLARRPAATTSSTVAGRSGAMRSRCGTYPTRQRSRRSPGARAEQLDRAGLRARAARAAMRSSVDFPEPFGSGERGELAGAHREAHVATAPARCRRRTTRPSAAARRRIGRPVAPLGELSMILIMAARADGRRHGRRECRVTADSHAHAARARPLRRHAPHRGPERRAGSGSPSC